MESTIRSARSAGGAGALLLAALATLLGVLAMTGTSKAAETKTITVDNGRLTMGFVFLNNKILPADVPGPLDPNISNSSGSGTIDVNIDGSTATVTEEDFNMPIVWIPDPTAGGAPIPMKFGPQGDLTGTWNGATGALELTGTLRVDVIWGFDDGGAKICRFIAPNLTWTTGPNAISPGVPFSNGLNGNGAISTFWESLPTGESINGGNCAKPNAVVRDPGAVWLSSGISEVPPAPTCQAEGKDGLWPDCTEIEWPDPEPEPEVKISKVTVGKATVTAGKKVKLKVKVTNSGDLAASGLVVKLKSNKQAVKVPGRVKLNVPAGKTATATITVTARKNAKGKASITASTSGKTAKGVVTVKKAKKARKARKKRK
jgi:hypothetical protein